MYILMLPFWCYTRAYGGEVDVAVTVVADQSDVEVPDGGVARAVSILMAYASYGL